MCGRVCASTAAPLAPSLLLQSENAVGDMYHSRGTASAAAKKVEWRRRRTSQLLACTRSCRSRIGPRMLVVAR